MAHIMKVRPAWKKKSGQQGGSIITLPSDVISQIDVTIGDSLSISVEEGTIVMRKVAEVR